MIAGVITICFWLFLHNKTVKTNNVANQTTLTTIDSSDLLKRLNSEQENFFVFVGRPTCPECKKFKPILEKNIKNINYSFYYYNTDERRDDAEFTEIIELLKVSKVPALLYVKENKIYVYSDNKEASLLKAWLEEVTS